MPKRLSVQSFMSTLTLLLTGVSIAGPGAVQADPTVPTVTYTTFDGFEPAQLFQLIDSHEYWEIPRDAPTGYYATVNLASAVTLRASLHDLIKDHVVFPYSHASTPGNTNHQVDVWDVVALADEHPTDEGRILDLYHNNTLKRQLKGSSSDPHYDREHSWPKSLGFPDQDNRNAAYSDCHHLFAAYSSYNSSRNNRAYGSVEGETGVEKPTVENLGRGGSLTPDADSSNFRFEAVWQTWLGRRGDVARAAFYMDVRYDGGKSAEGNGEPDLQLTDDLSKIKSCNVWKDGGIAYMGLKAALLSWHQQDPVDDLERRRNTVVYLFQGNRNPFVDHPEWVGAVFGGALLPGNGGSPASANALNVAWINEIHYDNAGDDVGEFVEIAGSAGLNLEGWTLVAYNGNGGRAYKSIQLTGSVPSQQNGYGTVAFDFADLQNGPPDGVALVNAAGSVVDFISYEGDFSATDGPANQQASRNIGVAETNSTAAGQSLQLRGSGHKVGDFQWNAAAPATRGAVNQGQQFSSGNN